MFSDHPGWSKASIPSGTHIAQRAEILLMEEILHHLGCIRPFTQWDILHINRCRIPSINSMNKTCGCMSYSNNVFFCFVRLVDWRVTRLSFQVVRQCSVIVTGTSKSLYLFIVFNSHPIKKYLCMYIYIFGTAPQKNTCLHFLLIYTVFLAYFAAFFLGRCHICIALYYFSALNLICLGISSSTARNLHNHDLSDDCKPSTKLCQWENQKRKNRKPKTKNTHFSIEYISSLQANYVFISFFVRFFPKRFQKLNKIRRLFPFCVGFCLSPSNIKPSKNCRSWIWRSFLGKKPTKCRNKTFCEFFRFVSKLSEKRHLGLEFGGNFARGSTIFVCVFLMCFLTWCVLTRY